MRRAEEAEQLERGAIGPVGVFANDDRRARSRGKGGKDCPEEPIAARRRRAASWSMREAERRAPDRAAAPSGPGVESASHEVRSTAAASAVPAAERVDQSRLANAGLAANQHQASMPCGRPAADAPRVAPGAVRARVAPSPRSPGFEAHDTPCPGWHAGERRATRLGADCCGESGDIVVITPMSPVIILEHRGSSSFLPDELLSVLART